MNRKTLEQDLLGNDPRPAALEDLLEITCDTTHDALVAAYRAGRDASPALRALLRLAFARGADEDASTC